MHAGRLWGRGSVRVRVVMGLVVVVVAAGGLVVGTGRAEAASRRVPLDLVALGDSYSAGVGVGTVGTDCDQDRYAWAPRAYNDQTLIAGNYERGSIAHEACSGHVIEQVRAEQLAKVTSTRDVATISVGGNDIGFAQKVAGCVLGDCTPDVWEISADVPGGSQTWDLLRERLVALYTEIRQRMSKTGSLYVMSYPIPFALREQKCAGFTGAEQRAANALVTRLNDTIAAAVDALNKNGVYDRPGNTVLLTWSTSGQRIAGGYTVPAGYANSGSTFDVIDDAEYGLCNRAGNTANIQGLLVSGAPRVLTEPKAQVFLGNSFHPGTTGYWRAAKVFYERLHSTQRIITDATAFGCGDGCTVTGTVSFTHPTWGPSTLVTTVRDSANSLAPDCDDQWDRWVADATGTVKYTKRRDFGLCSQGSTFAQTRSMFGPSIGRPDQSENLFVTESDVDGDQVIALVPERGGLRERAFGAHSEVIDLGKPYVVISEECYACSNPATPDLYFWSGSDYSPVGPVPSGGQCDTAVLSGSISLPPSARLVSAASAGMTCDQISPRIQAAILASPPDRSISIPRIRLVGEFVCVQDVAVDDKSSAYVCGDGRRGIWWILASASPPASRTVRNDLNTRTGPSTRFPQGPLSIPRGSTVSIMCQTDGELVLSQSGDFQSATWDLFDSGLWITDLWVVHPDIPSASSNGVSIRGGSPSIRVCDAAEVPK